MKIKLQQKQLKQPSVTNSTPISPETTNYDEWMKLSLNNKITPLNSFNAPLIDYFSNLTILYENDKINFQKASFTLDSCVKVYQSRIDKIEKESESLLKSVACIKQGKVKEEEDKDMDEEVEKVKKGGNNLMSNAQLSKKLEKECLVFNSQLKKIQQKDGVSNSLLVNNLYFSNNFNYCLVEDEIPKENLLKFGHEFDFELKSTEKSVCKSLVDFCFVQETPSSNGNSCYDDLLSQAMSQLSFVEASGNVANETILNQTTFEGINQPQFGGDGFQGNIGFNDDSLHDDTDSQDESVAGNNFEENFVGFEEENAVNTTTSGNFTTTMVTEDVSSTLYNYFNTYSIKNWFGPSMKKAFPSFFTTGTSTTRKEKVPFYIDFHSKINEADLFAKGAKTVLVKQKEKRNLLPVDIHYSFNDLDKFFMKKYKGKSSLRSTKVVTSSNQFHNEGNDVPDFGNDATDFDAHQYNYNDNHDSDDETGIPETFSFDFDASSTINYTKRAKRIDIKKLKENVWKEIPNNKQFKDIIKNVSNVSLEKDEVSVSYYFICLLHLCNEKGLDVKEREGDLEVLCE